MSTLTSLLVRDRVVPVRKIEEAIQRQVVSGAELEDVLLDMGLVAENVVNGYRAALHGMTPSTRQRVMQVSRDTIRIVPKEVAEEYRLVPIEAEGRILIVAVAEPLPPDQDERLSFLLGHRLEYRIVTRLRVRAALAHHYGVAMSAADQKLADRVREREPGDLPTVHPFTPKHPGATPAGFSPGDGAGAEHSYEVSSGSIPVAADSTPKTLVEVDPTPAQLPSAPAVDVARVVGVGSEPAAPPNVHAAETSPGILASPSRQSAARLPFRGPLSARDAVQALAKAGTRDEVLDTFFNFARPFFDYTVLFVVHDDIAEGREAYGSGRSRDEVSRIAVPLDVPGTFCDVRRTLESRVIDLRASELDALVCRDLGREQQQPSMIVPVAVRGRAVVILYGDRGGSEFLAADLPELSALVPRVGEAFEKIILQRKYGAQASVRPPAARRERKSAPLEVLGVPRSAPPPPPESESMPPPEASSPPPPAGSVAIGQLSSKRSMPTVLGLSDFESSAAQAGPQPAESLGVVPEVAEPEGDTPRARVATAEGGTYQVHNAATDVVRERPRATSEPQILIAPPDSLPAPPSRPQVPPPRSGQTSDMPSVIVNMGRGVEKLVDDLITRGPEDEEPAVSSLLAVGDAALPVLVQRFPGPLWFDRRRPHRRLPRGRDISAIARALTRFGERAVPYVASLLDVTNDDKRFYAVLLCSEFRGPGLLPPLGRRIFDRDPGLRSLVLDVLRRYYWLSEEMEDVLKGVRVEARVHRRDSQRQRVAVRALGELRDQGSLELLIELLGSTDREVVKSAHRSLTTLTRQDFGESGRRWMQWAEKEGTRHRIEWLIESLMHADDHMRAAAGDELKALTQEYYGYHPAAPRKDREIAQRKYREWWDSRGHRRYTRDH